MTTTHTHRHLTTSLLATLLIGASVHAQFGQTFEPAGIKPPADFGASLLMDPVDVAVMGWCHTPISWTYVADAVSHKIVRWVMTPTGAAAVPMEWTAFSEGPFGVAVNDIPGHPHQDTVYATGTNLLGEPCVQAFDRWGNVLNSSFKGNPSGLFVCPTGIAVGPEGNVYVVDQCSNLVEEFDPLGVKNAGTFNPENTYRPVGRPFDVSVDLMRRVHVSVFPGMVPNFGRIETFQYGNTDPETLFTALDISGIDARDLARTRYSNSDGNVKTLSWDDVLLPGYGFSLYDTQSIPISTSSTLPLGGLELQRTWRVIHSIGDDKVVECDRRTYVTDRADGEMHILSTKKKSTPRPDDAVAWWKLDEDGNSSLLNSKEIMNNRTGTWNGSGLKATEGVVKCALSFDGGSSGVDVPNHSILEVGSSDFSLEAWIRVAQPQAGTITFFDKRSLAGVGYRAILIAGQLAFQINDGTSTNTTTSTINIEDGLWHHVAMTVTRSANTKLYVDGDLVTTDLSAASVTGPLSSGESLSLGRDNATGSSGLIGGLDEVTLYHRALTDSEISAIDFAECGGKHLPHATFGLIPIGATSVSLPPLLGHGVSL